MAEAEDSKSLPRDDSERARPRAAPEVAGMTLIEVLVAMVILAFGLLAVAGMAGAVAMHTRMGGNVTGQTAAGQEVVEELQTKGYSHPDLAAGTSGTRQVTVASHTYTVDYDVNLIGTDLKEIVAVVERTRDLPPDTVRTLVSAMAGSPGNPSGP